MKENKRLSLCVVTRNDEKYISSCLENMGKLADEIIITDTGSTDKTVELAEEAGAKVYRIQWKENYSECKNLCLDMAGGRWILFLRANETVAAEQLEEIVPLLEDPNMEGYLLYIDSPADKHRISSPVQSLRLFRNRREYRFKYRAFERIPDELLSNVGNSGVRVIRKESPDTPGDANSLLPLLQEDLKEYPEDPYLRYIHGIELLNQKRYEESIAYFQTACEGTNLDCLYAPHLYKCLGWSFISLQRQKDALPVLEEGIKQFPFYTDLLVMRGELRKQLGQYEAAMGDMEAGLKIGEQKMTAVPAPDIGAPVILETLGDIHEQVFNYRAALACYRQAYGLYGTNPGLLSKINRLAEKKDPAQVMDDLIDSAMAHNNLEQLLHEDEADTQPLEALEYVLWSKVFTVKLDKMADRIRQGNTGTITAGAPKPRRADKPGKALLAFYRSLCRYQEAINGRAMDAEAEESTCSGIHRTIGCIYENAKKKREAFGAYLRALRWDPLLDKAQNKVKGMLQAEPGLFTDVEEEAEGVMEGGWFSSKEEFIGFITGLVHFKNSDFGKAAELFSKTAENSAVYPIALAYIAGSLWMEGKEEEAEKQLLQQRDTAVLSFLLRICSSLVMDELAEGQRLYPYSEIIAMEKQRIRDRVF